MTSPTAADEGWAWFARRLAPSRNYWLGTTGPDGAPHAAPVWGVVLHATWYAFSERATVKARNLQADPRAVVHLEDGDDVVLVRGRLEPVDPSGLGPVEAAFAAKYDQPDDAQYHPSAGDEATIFYALVPSSARAWVLADWDATDRRWTAEP